MIDWDHILITAAGVVISTLAQMWNDIRWLKQKVERINARLDRLEESFRN